MTNCVNKRNILNLLKVCVAEIKVCAAEIKKPEYRKPLQAIAVLSVAVFGVYTSIRLLSEGRSLVIETGLVPVEIVNTIVGACAFFVGVFLFVYFCILPGMMCLRMFKNVSNEKTEARGE